MIPRFQEREEHAMQGGDTGCEADRGLPAVHRGELALQRLLIRAAVAGVGQHVGR